MSLGSPSHTVTHTQHTPDTYQITDTHQIPDPHRLNRRELTLTQGTHTHSTEKTHTTHTTHGECELSRESKEDHR